MKNYIFLFLFFSSFILTGQAPYPMPSLILTQPYLQPTSNSIHNYGPIETNGNFNVLQGTYTDIVTTQSIKFTTGATVKTQTTGPYANNNLTARIEDEELELAWFYPNSPGWVQLHDKLEFGIKLPANVEAQIQNFIDNETTPNTLPKLNPFNPEDIDIKAEFYLKVGNNWVKKKKKYGFFYEDFERNTTDPDTNNWDWSRLSTIYNFRVRMTPEDIGEWKCRIFTHVNGFGTLQTADFHFKSYSSSKDGFVKVDQSTKQYLTINNDVFFPIGRVLQGPGCFVIKDINGNIISDPYNCSAVQNFDPSDDYWYVNKGFPIHVYSHIVYEKQLTKMSNDGANFFRISNTPSYYDIEFEKLGNYYSRMHMGWEMDRMLDLINQLGLKTYFTMSHAGELRYKDPWDWLGESLFDWSPDTVKRPHPLTDKYYSGYCYGSELGLNPNEFFTDSTAKKHYKNKLRYFISRWGYSTNIAAIDLINEVNQFKGEDPYFPVTRLERENWLIEMHDYIKNVLEHKNHLIGVHHTGADEILPDTSGPGVYQLSRNMIDPNVDIISLSTYDGPFSRESDNTNSNKINSYYNKPFLFLEIGIGGSEYVDFAHCDKYIEQSKDLWTSTFTNSAGTGLNWHRWNESREIWHQFGNVNGFLNNLDFRKFNEAYYLKNNSELGEMQYRINKQDNQVIGVIINRSWNQFTSGEGVCKDDSKYDSDELVDVVKTHKNISSKNRKDHFKILVGGTIKRYSIKYYGGLESNLYFQKTDIKWSDPSGMLRLNDFFDISTMTAFKIYPLAGPSFIIPQNDSFLTIDTMMHKEIPYYYDNTYDTTNIDSKNNLTSIDFEESNEISVFPNPTRSIFTIKIPEQLKSKIDSYVIIGVDGNIIIEKTWKKNTFEKVDLSNYPSGIYIVGMYGDEKYYYKRIIKQ